VYSRIKIKSSSQVNFLAYYGSTNQSTFTKFWNLKTFSLRYGTVRAKWKTGFTITGRRLHRYNYLNLTDYLNQLNIREEPKALISRLVSIWASGLSIWYIWFPVTNHQIQFNIGRTSTFMKALCRPVCREVNNQNSNFLTTLCLYFQVVVYP
jgi:hypothetical protein